ncbi:MAG: hypothetical protein MHM6MM_001129 [Cercozoa sp. M6MM]
MPPRVEIKTAEDAESATVAQLKRFLSSNGQTFGKNKRKDYYVERAVNFLASGQSPGSAPDSDDEPVVAAPVTESRKVKRDRSKAAKSLSAAASAQKRRMVDDEEEEAQASSARSSAKKTSLKRGRRAVEQEEASESESENESDEEMILRREPRKKGSTRARAEKSLRTVARISSDEDFESDEEAEEPPQKRRRAAPRSSRIVAQKKKPASAPASKPGVAPAAARRAASARKARGTASKTAAPKAPSTAPRSSAKSRVSKKTAEKPIEKPAKKPAEKTVKKTVEKPVFPRAKPAPVVTKPKRQPRGVATRPKSTEAPRTTSKLSREPFLHAPSTSSESESTISKQPTPRVSLASAFNTSTERKRFHPTRPTRVFQGKQAQTSALLSPALTESTALQSAATLAPRAVQEPKKSKCSVARVCMVVFGVFASLFLLALIVSKLEPPVRFCDSGAPVTDGCFECPKHATCHGGRAVCEPGLVLQGVHCYESTNMQADANAMAQAASRALAALNGRVQCGSDLHTEPVELGQLSFASDALKLDKNGIVFGIERFAMRNALLSVAKQADTEAVKKSFDKFTDMVYDHDVPGVSIEHNAFVSSRVEKPLTCRLRHYVMENLGSVLLLLLGAATVLTPVLKLRQRRRRQRLAAELVKAAIAELQREQSMSLVALQDTCRNSADPDVSVAARSQDIWRDAVKALQKDRRVSHSVRMLAGVQRQILHWTAAQSVSMPPMTGNVAAAF